MNSSTENKALIQELYQTIFEDWKMAEAGRFIAPQFVDHDMPPGMPAGPAGFEQFYDLLRSAFPDLRYTVQAMIAEDDKVVVQWNWQATHTGNFFGLPATGKNADTTGIAIYRLENGKAVERWVKFDMAGLMRKLTA